MNWKAKAKQLRRERDSLLQDSAEQVEIICQLIREREDPKITVFIP